MWMVKAKIWQQTQLYQESIIKFKIQEYIAYQIQKIQNPAQYSKWGQLSLESEPTNNLKNKK